MQKVVKLISDWMIAKNDKINMMTFIRLCKRQLSKYKKELTKINEGYLMNI